ncbi:WYL domain-containing protein [Micromonospora polyrhachis]
MKYCGKLLAAMPTNVKNMLETSARLLRLLTLLQAKPDWTGAELAARLDVSPRTIRYDVDKLRNLGYPVHAAPGIAGGYRLGAGAKLPPLLLDDDEAVAVAVGLRTAAIGSVTGIEESAVNALAKLEQVLPPRLRQRVTDLHTYTTPLIKQGDAVSAETLTRLAAACRDHHRVRFTYTTHEGSTDERDTEPHRLVHTGRRWYLIAWDTARRDWRTYRVDRITPLEPTGMRFVPRPHPPDPAGVIRGVDTALSTHRAKVTVLAPASAITSYLPDSVAVQPIDDTSCVVHAGADTPYQLALHILMLDKDFHVHGPPDLLDAFAVIRDRLNAITY